MKKIFIVIIMSLSLFFVVGVGLKTDAKTTEKITNNGFVSEIYFNFNLSNDELTEIFRSVNYIQTPLLNNPIYPILCKEDYSLMLFITKIDDDESRIHYDLGYTSSPNPNDYIQLYELYIPFSEQAVEYNDVSNNKWYKINLDINSNVVDNYSGIPVGTENEKLVDLFSVKPFISNNGLPINSNSSIIYVNKNLNYVAIDNFIKLTSNIIDSGVAIGSFFNSEDSSVANKSTALVAYYMSNGVVALLSRYNDDVTSGLTKILYTSPNGNIENYNNAFNSLDIEWNGELGWQEDFTGMLDFSIPLTIESNVNTEELKVFLSSIPFKDNERNENIVFGLFDTIGEIAQSFGTLLVGLFEAVVSLLWTEGNLSIVGVFILIGITAGLFIWAFGYIRRLIRIKKG